jgi:hypothetical protein
MPIVLYDASKLHPDDLNGILVSEKILCGIVNNYPIGRTAVPFEAIDMYANNDRTFRVFVKTPDLNIVNLTGATAVLTIKEKKTDTTNVLVKSTSVAAQADFGARDEGEIFFYIVPEDTATLAIQQYVYDVKVTLQSGKKYTVIEGVLNLHKAT